VDRLPPRLLRRLIIAPLVLALCLLLLALSPVLLLAAFLADLVLPGDWRTVRLTAYGVCYLVLEVVGLVAMFGLWVASGFGLRMRAMQEVHYDFLRWWLRSIDRASRWLFHLRVHVEDRPDPKPGPILVFCRHAGPGNSLLLVGSLLVGYRRHTRIVMLAKLQWEPLYDVMLNRLPNRFIQHDPARRDLYLRTIGELATNLGDRDALVLFPEGKDFTHRVRRRTIDYLRGKGHAASAERAEKLQRVLPPRHNGVMAALAQAPEADVVFVAHAVLEDVGTFGELWSRIPLQRAIPARYWRLPPSEVPREKEQVIEWLYSWWEKMDAWILDRSLPRAEEDSPAPAVRPT